ncbi:APC family permease [Caminibacter mediatlanticus TB-2]|uniref:APC family permease n=1 Tax=Caminibacter mediatlanticus TB-2 TaxID=391592 RepID=A0ABX5VAN8_9BACT|nr:APC family permease [Caminibacter mediatlanticus]QCT94432.1 APC family permease [Caminibacter mediatlanticus TB-2]
MKAFNTFSAAMLGIGSMVGVGIFIVIGLAGSIAGNLVWISFIIGGIIALLSGYSLAKLALRYPSRGGIIEYLIQEYGENYFSGALSVMFYFAQLITLAAVAKSFGEYAARLFGYHSKFIIDLFAIGILLIFTIINLLGAIFVAKSENTIVIIKLTALTIFTIVALFNINPQYLSLKDSPPIFNTFFAVALTFFAYQGYSVITNTIEDMQNPKKTILKAMFLAIGVVTILYVSVSIAVLGNLPLDEVIKAKDYALAEAAKPIFGEYGFKIMSIIALISATTAINATLYAATEISYTLAKKGELPKIYKYNVFHSYEGLIISTILIIPMILFLNLSEITTVAALSVLIIQALVHFGHIKLTPKTGANKTLIVITFILMTFIVLITLLYNYHKNILIIYYLFGGFILSFMIEYLLRKFTHKKVKKSIKNINEELIKE